MTKTVDYLIVGQGLAGSILAYQIHKKGKSVCIIDNHEPNTASKVAIGLVNPITGKRLVKSWLIDELIESSRKLYCELEKLFHRQFIHHQTIARIIPNQDIFEQWKPNFEQAVEEGYIENKIHDFTFNGKSHQYFSILKGFWLDTTALLEEFRDYFKKLEAITTENIDYSNLEITDEDVIYKDISAKKVIFCEGAAAVNNPFFNDLPFNLNKGEVIDVMLKDYNFKHILKKNIFIVPDENKFRIGATYNRDFKDDKVSDEALTYFTIKVDEVLGIPFQLLNHKAAIRPATVDRRPFIGTHQEYKNLGIFNGFGAKGVSLVPYFSEHYCDYLLEGKELMKEANINRYYKS